MKDKEIYLDIFDEEMTLSETDDFITEELSENSSDIAIVGMSVKAGLCENSQELWDSLISGEELIAQFPYNRELDVKQFCDWVGRGDEKFRKECYLEKIDLFCPEFFNMLPKDASLMDPAQRLFLMTAWNALEDANISASDLDGTDTGVYVGYTAPTDNYSEILAQSDPEFSDRAIPGMVNSVIACRLSYWLNLRGPAVMIDTACSSSLVAVHTACNAIRQGDCKQALVGSVKVNLMPLMGKGDNNVSVLSKSGSTRTFDAEASGTNPGEGVAALFLKTLDAAKKDKDRIYAVIKGSAINQDGTSVGITAPNSEAQEAVIVKAWENAGIDPEKISYIETHGTATKLGDPVEITAIDRAFKRFTNKKQFCSVGSVKANLGHLDCASGILGLIKCILEIQNKTLLPQINYMTPNKEIDFISSAVYVSEKTAKWDADYPRTCGVSSFGMSGTNCHVILQEYEDDHESKECFPMVLPLSARNEDELIKIADDFSCWVKKDGINLSDCIYSVSVSKSDYSVRAAVVINSFDDIKDLSENVKQICSNHYESSKESDIEAERIINKLVNESVFAYDDLITVSKLYNMGANVDWQKLYKNLPVKKTSVPGYPMNLQHCWMVPKSKNRKFYHTEVDHLIDSCLIASPKLYVYETCMSEETHTEVAEHVIGDKNVLAGTVYVEILHCAAEKVLKTDKMQVNNLIFMNAMIFDKGQTREIQTILYQKSDKKYDVTIQSKPVGEELWEIHAQGQVELLPEEKSEAPEPLNIQEIVNNLQTVNLDSSGSPVEQMVITGPRWRVNRAMWVGENEAVTMAMIDAEFLDELNWYYLYPSMLDAAVNCSSILNGSNFCLPYYYGTLRIYRNIPEKIYSHTVKNLAASSSDGELNVFNVQIVDEKGNVVAEVDNYAMKRAGANQKKKFYQKADPYLHTIDWIEETSTFKASDLENTEKAVIVVRTIDDCNEQLLERIRAKYKNNVYELILCNWEMRNTKTKYYAEPDDLKKISDTFNNFNKIGIDQVIYMAPDNRSIASQAELSDSVDNMLCSLFNITKALASNKNLGNVKLNLIIKTNGKEIDPMAMAIQGMGKSLFLEYTRIKMRCILFSPETNLNSVIDEMSYNYNDYSILLENGKRFVFGMKEIPLEEDEKEKHKFILKKNGTYIVTGGLGGIGLVLAEYLADKEPEIRLVLMSRRRLSSKDNWKNEKDQIYRRLSALDNKVNELICYSCDVSDEKAIQTLSEKLDSVSGIIHSAGMAGGGFVIKREWDDFLDVLKPKMHGTLNMLKLGEKFKTDFVVLFSSYSTILPVAGQADYICANSFIDAIPNNNELTIPVKVINWSGWRECGMAFDNGIELDSNPVTFLSNTEGTKLFTNAMEVEEPQVLVGKINCEVLAEVAKNYNNVIRYPDYVSEKLKRLQGKAKNPREVYNVTVKGKESPLTETETKVSQAWAKVLGLKEIDYQDKFLEIGGDSLSATYLQKELDKTYPQIMDITDVFIYSSIKETADYIDSKIKPMKNEKINNQVSETSIENVKNTTHIESDSKDDINKMLKMLADGKIDVKEAAKYL